MGVGVGGRGGGGGVHSNKLSKPKGLKRRIYIVAAHTDDVLTIIA